MSSGNRIVRVRLSDEERSFLAGMLRKRSSEKIGQELAKEIKTQYRQFVLRTYGLHLHSLNYFFFRHYHKLSFPLGESSSTGRGTGEKIGVPWENPSECEQVSHTVSQKEIWTQDLSLSSVMTNKCFNRYTTGDPLPLSLFLSVRGSNHQAILHVNKSSPFDADVISKVADDKCQVLDLPNRLRLTVSRGSRILLT